MTDDANIEAGVEGRRAQLLKGLAELGLLSVLSERRHYGLEILDRLRAEAGLPMAEGTIYPLLHRLERGELVASEWVLDDAGGRPRRYYRLTPKGEAELAGLRAEWRRISVSLTGFLERGGGDGR